MATSPRIWLPLVLGFSLASSVQAEIYAGGIIGFSNLEHTSNNQSITSSPILMQVQVGHFYSDYFALEGRYGRSFESDNHMSIEHSFSLLAKGNLPISDQVAIYALSGLNFTKAQINTTSYSNDDVSFGLGLHYALNRNTAITFEMVNNSADNQAQLSSYNLSYQVRF